MDALTEFNWHPFSFSFNTLRYTDTHLSSNSSFWAATTTAQSVSDDESYIEDLEENKGVVLDSRGNSIDLEEIEEQIDNEIENDIKL